MKRVKLSFRDFYLGRRPWLSEGEITAAVRASVNFSRTKEETLTGAKALLLRESENIRAWLVRTNRRLYRLTENRLEEQPKINWSVPLANAKGKGVEVVSSSESGAPTAIAFPFRPGKETRVDPKLFQPLGVERGIAEFINSD
jgi:hypothetical protein